GHLIVRSEDIEKGRLLEKQVDMVILSVGLEPADGSSRVAELCGVTTDEDGWINEDNYVMNPVNTSSNGVLVAGLCQGPKDIPDTVAQASAAAAEVLKHIVRGKIKNKNTHISLPEIELRLKELSPIYGG
ncbi:MAG: hypothetical protein R3182_06985, partial [Draconibacterium sp.]|nr:hypothetical protein [Draconibacterium sp.]